MYSQAWQVIRGLPRAYGSFAREYPNANTFAVSVAFATLLIPGVAAGRLKKYDEMDARVKAGTAAHEREAAPIRESADATIAAYAKRKQAETGVSSPEPHS